MIQSSISSRIAVMKLEAEQAHSSGSRVLNISTKEGKLAFAVVLTAHADELFRMT
jgi:hypothetical protein